VIGLLRSLVDAVGFVVTIPFWLPVRLSAMLSRSVHVRMFQQASQALALGPGEIGNVLRRCFYRLTLDSCSDRCTISFGTIFSSPHARIGRGVYVGAYCSLGACSIEDDSMLGSFVSVLSGKLTHRFERTDIPIRHQGGEQAVVTLHRDCWIGNGAIILADVSTGTVIGAGSVLTRTPAPKSIAVGNPARVIGHRGAEGDDTPPQPATIDAPAEPARSELPPAARSSQ
jgi:virginiamycin A acetyltransferase